MTLASSPEDVLGEVAVPAAEPSASAPDATLTADPSPANDGEKTMADAISDVLGDASPPAVPPATEKEGPESEDEPTEPKPDAAKEETPGEKPDASEAKEGEDDEELSDEPTDEELASYKPKTQKRVRQLLDVKKRYEQFGTPEEIEQFKQSHETFSGIVSYMEEASLSVDEVNTGFDIMAAMRNDPVKAYEMLRPYMQQLESVIGETLPPDLQAQVEQGYLTENAARDLAKSKSRERLAQEQAAKAREKADSLQNRQITERTAQAVSEAVSSWETRQMASDPDYAKKQARIMERIELHAHRNGGIPSNPQEAVALAERIHKEVTAELKAYAPKRKPIAPDPDSSSPNRATPAPTNMVEAIQAGLTAA